MRSSLVRLQRLLALRSLQHAVACGDAAVANAVVAHADAEAERAQQTRVGIADRFAAMTDQYDEMDRSIATVETEVALKVCVCTTAGYVAAETLAAGARQRAEAARVRERQMATVVQEKLQRNRDDAARKEQRQMDEVAGMLWGRTARAAETRS